MVSGEPDYVGLGTFRASGARFYYIIVSILSNIDDMYPQIRRESFIWSQIRNWKFGHFPKNPIFGDFEGFLAKNLRRFYPIDTKITQDDLWLIRISDSEGRRQRPTGSAIKRLKTRNVAYLRSGTSWRIERQIEMFAMAIFILMLWSNIYPKMLSFRDNRQKLICCIIVPHSVFANISKNKHFRVYVAS